MTKIVEGSQSTRAKKAIALIRKGAPVTHAAKVCRVAPPTLWAMFPEKMTEALKQKAIVREEPDPDMRKKAVRALDSLGWKRVNIAAALGVKPQFISQLLSGKR